MPLYSLISFGGDQRFELPAGRTLLVGRAVECDVPVFDPTVSRHHAELTADEFKRYSRHLIMPEVGVDGQRRLKAASVLCIGAGGALVVLQFG